MAGAIEIWANTYSAICLVRQAFAAPAFTFRSGSVRTTAYSMFTKLSPPN